MTRVFETLLGRLWLWLPPLLFVLVNLAVLGFQRGVLAGRAAAASAAVASAERDSEELRRRHLDLADRSAAVTAAELDRQQLYGKRFATPEERLTASIAEVKELALRSGLAIAAITYPEQAIEPYGLLRRSFVFSVEGSYAELRQLIYLIELTPSFLTLERLSVGETGRGGELRADLRLSTLFTVPDEERPKGKGKGGRK